MSARSKGGTDMRSRERSWRASIVLTCSMLLASGGLTSARAQESRAANANSALAAAQAPPAATPTFEVYGFAMLDIGLDFKQIHPDWYDTLRITKLPQV